MALRRPALRQDARRDRSSALESRPWTTVKRREPIDAASVLTVYFVLMLAVPARATFAPLGSVGAPANVVALAVFVWWVWHHLHRPEPDPGFAQPVRRVALALLLLMTVVYRHAMVQPLMSDEVMPADSGLIRFFAVMGIVLAATDGISSEERLHILVNRITIGAGAVAVLALVQVATGQLWVDRLIPPGLTLANPEESLISRGAFLRPSGTSVHPIELGAVLSMLLPLAISHARTTEGRRFWPWFRVAAVLFAVLISFSRTALVCTAVVLLTLSVLWSTRARWAAAAVGLLGSVGAAVAVPGLAGTIRGLFTGAADDPSVQSRTAGYDYAMEMFQQNPWFGRGYGTFIPRYYIFDNGYLQFTMEAGAVGLVLLIGLLATGMVCALSARRLLVNRQDRELAQALLAGLLAGATSIGFFDLFAFPQSAGCLALLLGLSGGFYRLVRARRLASPVGD